MNATKTAALTLAFLALGTVPPKLVPAGFAASWGSPRSGPQSAEPAAQSAVARRIGAVKTIDGTTITLAPDSGPVVTVTVQEATRLMRVAPGEKNLKNATPIQLQDLQVGDRILVGGKSSDDEKSIAASSIVVMKISDVEARHQQELQDWQKRGLGGPITAVDAATGTVTISVTGFGGTKSIAVHTSKDTVIRRYAPDSVKFDDAKPSALPEIQPGDQLRARGARSADGTEFAAEEIVTGSFQNVAGTVNSVDASTSTLSIQDLRTKKAVLIKITSDSQLHTLPVEMAQHIAARLKGSMPGMAGGTGGGTGGGAAGSAPAGTNPPPTGNGPGGQSGTPRAGGQAGSGAGGGMRSGGTPDLQQMLSRLPAVALTDLHKGDAVMLVATHGSSSSGGTAITLVSGVEPILQAAPNASQAMMLAPWSLGAPAAADAASQ